MIFVLKDIKKSQDFETNISPLPSLRFLTCDPSTSLLIKGDHLADHLGSLGTPWPFSHLATSRVGTHIFKKNRRCLDVFHPQTIKQIKHTKTITSAIFSYLCASNLWEQKVPSGGLCQCHSTFQLLGTLVHPAVATQIQQILTGSNGIQYWKMRVMTGSWWTMNHWRCYDSDLYSTFYIFWTMSCWLLPGLKKRRVTACDSGHSHPVEKTVGITLLLAATGSPDVDLHHWISKLEGSKHVHLNIFTTISNDLDPKLWKTIIAFQFIFFLFKKKETSRETLLNPGFTKTPWIGSPWASTAPGFGSFCSSQSQPVDRRSNSLDFGGKCQVSPPSSSSKAFMWNVHHDLNKTTCLSDRVCVFCWTNGMVEASQDHKEHYINIM